MLVDVFVVVSIVVSLKVSPTIVKFHLILSD